MVGGAGGAGGGGGGGSNTPAGKLETTPERVVKLVFRQVVPKMVLID